MMAFLSLFLWIRGWRAHDLHLTINWNGTKSGLKLWLLDIAIYYAFGIIAMLLFPTLQASAENLKYESEVSLPVVTLLSIINPIYEETITVLYIVKRLDWARPSVIFITSACLRSAVHAYQGAFAMTSVFVMGLVFAWYFWKKRQLWPLIFAHALMDFIGLIMASMDSD